MTDYSGLASNLPLINVSETYDQTWLDLYVVYHILDDLQPGSGQVYCYRYAGIVSQPETLYTFMSGDLYNPLSSSLLPALNQAAQATANSIQAAGGNFQPAAISGLKSYIDTLHFWNPAKDILKSVINDLGQQFSALDPAQFTQDVQVADLNDQSTGTDTVIQTSSDLSFSSEIGVVNVANNSEVQVDGNGLEINAGNQELNVQAGQLVLADANLQNVGQLLVAGDILIDPSELVTDSLSGTGNVTIGADSVLDVTEAGGFTGNIVFDGDGGTLILENPWDFTGQISGFKPGDVLVLGSLSVYQNEGTLYDGALLVTTTGDAVVSVPFDAGDYTNDDLLLESNIAGIAISEIAKPTASNGSTQSIHPAYYNGSAQSYIAYDVQLALSNTDVYFAPIRENQERDQSVGITLTVDGISGQAGTLQNYLLVEPYNTDASGIFLSDSGFQDLGPTSPTATFTMYTGFGVLGEQSVSTGVVIFYDSIQSGSGPDGPEVTQTSATLSVVGHTEVYTAAQPEFIINGATDASYYFGGLFSGIHVGQTASVAVTIVNVANGPLQDNLITNPNVVGDFTAENGINLAPGQSGIVTVSVYGYTAGNVQAGDDLFGLTSHDARLPDLALNGYYGYFNAKIVNYAAPVLYNAFISAAPTTTNPNGLVALTGSTAGTLTQDGNNWDLDFGTILQGDPQSYFANVVVENAAPTYLNSDDLTGSVTATGTGIIYALGPVSDETALGGGLIYIELGDFIPDLSNPGTEQATIVFSPLSIDQWSTTALPPITLTVEADVVACFVAGTRVTTARGEIPVEDLRLNDLIPTLHANIRRIKWIGIRSYDGRFIADQHLVLPVCVKRGALAENVPSRDLWISPGHAIYIDGVLIPTWRLINGVSILQAPSVESVTYYHIELDEHEVIFADGCPAESFVDDNCRNQFQNSAEFYALYPEDDEAERATCLPRVEDGFHLQAIQHRLSRRAGIAPATEKSGKLRGFVDQAGPDVVAGWAQCESQPEVPVCLDIMVYGRRVARVLANRYRADLRAASLGSGCHAFEIRLPSNLAGPAEVRRSADNAPLALTEEARTRAA